MTSLFDPFIPRRARILREYGRAFEVPSPFHQVTEHYHSPSSHRGLEWFFLWSPSSCALGGQRELLLSEVGHALHRTKCSFSAGLAVGLTVLFLVHVFVRGVVHSHLSASVLVSVCQARVPWDTLYFLFLLGSHSVIPLASMFPATCSCMGLLSISTFFSGVK